MPTSSEALSDFNSTEVSPRTPDRWRRRPPSGVVPRLDMPRITLKLNHVKSTPTATGGYRRKIFKTYKPGKGKNIYNFGNQYNNPFVAESNEKKFYRLSKQDFVNVSYPVGKPSGRNEKENASFNVVKENGHSTSDLDSKRPDTSVTLFPVVQTRLRSKSDSNLTRHVYSDPNVRSCTEATSAPNLIKENDKSRDSSSYLPNIGTHPTPVEGEGRPAIQNNQILMLRPLAGKCRSSSENEVGSGHNVNIQPYDIPPFSPIEYGKITNRNYGQPIHNRPQALHTLNSASISESNHGVTYPKNVNVAGENKRKNVAYRESFNRDVANEKLDGAHLKNSSVSGLHLKPLSALDQQFDTLNVSVQLLNSSEVSDQSFNTPDVSDQQLRTSDISEQHFGISDVSNDQQLRTSDVSCKRFDTSAVPDQQLHTSDVSGQRFTISDVPDQQLRNPDISDQRSCTPEVSDQQLRTSDMSSQRFNTSGVSDQKKNHLDVHGHHLDTSDALDQQFNTSEKNLEQFNTLAATDLQMNATNLPAIANNLIQRNRAIGKLNVNVAKCFNSEEKEISFKLTHRYENDKPDRSFYEQIDLQESKHDITSKQICKGQVPGPKLANKDRNYNRLESSGESSEEAGNKDMTASFLPELSPPRSPSNKIQREIRDVGHGLERLCVKELEDPNDDKRPIQLAQSGEDATIIKPPNEIKMKQRNLSTRTSKTLKTLFIPPMRRFTAPPELKPNAICFDDPGYNWSHKHISDATLKTLETLEGNSPKIQTIQFEPRKVIIGDPLCENRWIVTLSDSIARGHVLKHGLDIDGSHIYVQRYDTVMDREYCFFLQYHKIKYRNKPIST